MYIRQNIAFVTSSDGARIATASVGRGPVLVRAAHWLSHVEYDAESPVWRPWLAALSQGHRFLRYDQRGCGLSDRDLSNFSLALCALGLMYVPDPACALAEMARVTRPGGRVAVSVWGERRRCGWAEIFPIVDARVASEVCPMFFGPGGRGVLLHMAAGAGLTRVDQWRDRVTLEWPDAASLLTAMIDGGPVALAAKRFSPETRAEVEDEFLGSVVEWLQPDGSYAIPGEFVTVAGTV